MSPQIRANLVKVHAVIAAFCLPIGLMFLVTGGLYTSGYEGESSKEVFFIKLDKRVAFNQANLLQVAKDELDKREIEYPTGKIRYKAGKVLKELKWSGINKSLRLTSTSQPTLFRLTLKTPGWFRQFMQLHKAGGKAPFKLYAMAWAVLLFSLFVSGITMAWQVKKLRTLVVTSTLLGTITFASLMFHSVWYA